MVAGRLHGFAVNRAFALRVEPRNARLHRPGSRADYQSTGANTGNQGEGMNAIPLGPMGHTPWEAGRPRKRGRPKPVTGTCRTAQARSQRASREGRSVAARLSLSRVVRSCWLCPVCQSRRL